MLIFKNLIDHFKKTIDVDNFNYASRKCLYFILLTNVIASMMVTIFIPAFSSTATELNATQSLMQITIVAHLIGEVVGRISCGIASDYLGCKKSVIIYLIVSAFGLLGCALCTSISFLICMRFLQAIGSGAVYVVSLNYINYNFSGLAKCRAMSTLEMYQPIANLIAPICGGIICLSFGWRWIFLFLFILQICAILLIKLYMPLDRVLEKLEFSFHTIFIDYKNLIFNKKFFVYAVLPGFTVGGYLIYSSHVPEICEELNMSSEFNIVFFQSIPLVINLLASSIYRYTVRKSGVRFSRRIGAISNGIMSFLLALMIAKIFDIHNITLILIAMCIQCFSGAFIVPISVIGAMESALSRAGIAAASIVTLRNLVMAVSISLASIYTGIESCICEIFIATVIVLILLFFRKKLEHNIY